MKLPNHIYSRFTLITCLTVITGYIFVHAATTYYSDLPSVWVGSGLTSTSWNNLVNYANKAVKQDTEVLTVTGGNVGISTSNPQENLHIAGKLRVDTVSTQESIWAGTVTQVWALSSNIIFNVAGAPMLTLGAGTWLIFGSCFLTTTDVADAVNLALYNSTDSAIFGKSWVWVTGYGTQLIGTDMSTTGYLTIPSGTKTIYLYGIRNGGSTLRMGWWVPLVIPTSALRAIRLF